MEDMTKKIEQLITLDKPKTKEEVTLSRNSVTNLLLNKERLDTITKTMAFVMLENINETK